MGLLKQIRAIVLLPLMVLVVIPGLILFSTQPVWTGWPLTAPLQGLPITIGLVLIGLGLMLLVKTISLFIKVGQGTLAPWNPPQRFVIRGVYRYVRNPMITGVFSVLLGETILLGSIPLFYWFSAVILLNLIYIPFLEEPALEKRFGEDYQLYKQNVPRWIPRIKPWDGLSENE